MKKQEEDVNLDADYVVDEKLRTATLTARGICQGGKASSAWKTSRILKTPL
jgi:hypothetical protein